MSLIQRRLVCPECLCRFTVDELVWLDDRGVDGEGMPRRPSWWQRVWRWLVDDLPNDGRSGPHRQPGSEATLAALLESGWAPYCPDRHELPQDFHLRETLVVGLVGERAAGKSHYIAVLVNELVNGSSLMPYDLVAELAPGCHEHYLAAYWHWLYGGAAAGRPPAAGGGAEAGQDDLRPRPVPLTAVVDQESSPPPRRPITLVLRSTRTGRAVNVVLYDAAGEQMTTPQGQARYNKFLLGADALLLFVSPWALPDLRSLVEPAGDVVGQDILSSQLMFDSLASTIRTVRRVPDDADVMGVDTVVLLAKADQIRTAAGFDEDWLEDLDPTALGVDGVLLRMADETDLVSDFLTRYGGGNLVSKVSLRYPDARYAAMTTTGCSVDETGHYAAVTPARVVEPLLEILYRRGLVGHVRAGA